MRGQLISEMRPFRFGFVVVMSVAISGCQTTLSSGAPDEGNCFRSATVEVPEGYHIRTDSQVAFSEAEVGGTMAFGLLPDRA